MNRQYKVLVVDDEEEYCKERKALLTDRDLTDFEFIVETANSGAEGLEKLLNEEFDVAIVDIKMPKMSGIEMIRQALADDRVDTSFILLTGQGDKQDAIDAINLGVDAWFEKTSMKQSELLKRTEELAQVIPPDKLRRLLSLIPDKN